MDHRFHNKIDYVISAVQLKVRLHMVSELAQSTENHHIIFKQLYFVNTTHVSCQALETMTYLQVYMHLENFDCVQLQINRQ